MAVIRGAFATIGQIAFYEQVKQMLLASGYFKDNVITHFSSSFVAGKIKWLSMAHNGNVNVVKRRFQS